MTGAELNNLRSKAEKMLWKANELIRFINMNEISQGVINRHKALIGASHVAKLNHSINRRNVIIESLKVELSCIA